MVESKNVLELYIPRGARQGERIVLQGEADQLPDQEPGDIIFTLEEAEHETFERAGADLRAVLKISLVEALTGFNRVVLTHLDGRGIQLNVQQPNGKVLRPGQVLKVPGEGMPMKRSDAKGDLYLAVDIEFPEDGWLKDDAALLKVRTRCPRRPSRTASPTRSRRSRGRVRRRHGGVWRWVWRPPGGRRRVGRRRGAGGRPAVRDAVGWGAYSARER